jgi:hypothetical protein
VANAALTFAGGFGTAILTAILAVHVLGIGDAGGPVYSNTGLTVGFLVGALGAAFGVVQSYVHKAALVYSSDTSEAPETYDKSTAVAADPLAHAGDLQGSR